MKKRTNIHLSAVLRKMTREETGGLLKAEVVTITMQRGHVLTQSS